MKEHYASKDIALQRDNYICQKCGKPALTVAHRIAKSKANKLFIFKYIYEKKQEFTSHANVNKMIHHQFNLVTACNGNCNDSYNIGMNPEKSKKLIELIWSMGNENLSVKEIEEFLK